MKTLLLAIALSTFAAQTPVMAQVATSTDKNAAVQEDAAIQTMVGKMGGIRLDHATFHVADIEKSADFYHSLFQLRRVESAVLGLIWLQEDQSGFQIHLVPGREVQVQDNQAVHIAFAVPDFSNFLKLLNKRKILWFDSNLQSSSISRSRKDKVQQIYLRDPDGYWIEVNDASPRSSDG